MPEVFFQTNITKDGKRPYKWRWEVIKETRGSRYISKWEFRYGACSTQRGARKKALKARIKLDGGISVEELAEDRS